VLKVTKNLIELNYNDKKILMNTMYPRPLVFYKGINNVEKAIKNPNTILNKKLLDILCTFNILVSEEPVPKISQKFCHEGKNNLLLYLLVTQQCNLGCKYCVGNNPSYMNNYSMNFDVAKMAIEKAAQSMLSKGNILVVYFGGEPLLNWSLIKQCIDYISKLKYKFDVNFKNHITTNMTYLPDDFIEVASNNDISLLIDIDGYASIHDSMRPYPSGKGSYKQIIKNLQRIKKSGIYYELRTTITSHNADKIDGILDHHYDLSPSACGFPTLIPVNSEGNPIDSELYPNPNIFFKNLKKIFDKKLFDLSKIRPSNIISTRIFRGEFIVYGCSMILGNKIVVDHIGDAYPCIYFIGQNKFNLGNINDKVNPFLQSNCYKNLYLKYKDILHVDKIEKCQKCIIRYFCGGGCSVRMLSLNNQSSESQKSKDYFFNINCSYAWASVEGAIQYFEKKAKSDSKYISMSLPNRSSRC